MSANAELSAKMLDFTQVATEVVAEASKQAEENLAACKKAQPLVDKAADEILQETLVGEHERDEVVKLASTHAGALQLVSNLVRHIHTLKQADTQKAATAMGRGVSDNGREKKASVHSTESPFVGRRAGLGEKRASDEALFRGLGLNPSDLNRN